MGQFGRVPEALRLSLLFLCGIVGLMRKLAMVTSGEVLRCS